MPRKKHFDEDKPEDDIEKDDTDLTPETYEDTDTPENYGEPDVTAKTSVGEVERTKRTINLGASQLEKAPAGDSEGKEAELAPHATHTGIPRIPTQADFWLGGQGKAQQEALRRDEEDRRDREERHRQRNPTGRTKREQEAGEKVRADHESGTVRKAEGKAGKEALKAYDRTLPA